MHSWGDGFQYFDEVGNAAEDIGTFLRRWGRVHVISTKEKYGKARVYLTFGWHQLHSITHPGHHYSRYPQWLWHLDCQYFYKPISLLNPVVRAYQTRLYRYAYQRAINKYPNIKQEILSGADFPELLGGL